MPARRHRAPPIAVAGDDRSAVSAVMLLLEQIGVDAAATGPLASGKTFQVGP